MDPLSALAIFGPVAVELGKSLISRFIATETFKPATIEHWVQMRETDLNLFKAMNDAGGAQPSYQWVEAIVRLQRPFVATIVLGTWAGATLYGVSTPSINNFASAVGFYLFGDRTLFYARKEATK